MTEQLTGTEQLRSPDSPDGCERVGAAARLARTRTRRWRRPSGRSRLVGDVPGERGRVLERASELLMERQVEIAALVTRRRAARWDGGCSTCELAAGMLAYYAGQTDAPAGEDAGDPIAYSGQTGDAPCASRSASSSASRRGTRR